MNQYKSIVKELLAGYISKLRKRQKLTQEEMAEQLHITSRAYGDLERGKYCLSTLVLLFFLLILNKEEIMSLLEEFRKAILELENKDAA